MTDLSKIDIHDLLPQCEPFVMVGKLAHFEMDCTRTETTIQADNLFAANGVLTPSGIIENIAQTCAARIGYINKYILRRGIQIGFIGAIRNLHIHAAPTVGTTISTTIRTIEEVFGMTMVSAEMRSGEVLLAEAEMKIALSDKEQS